MINLRCSKYLNLEYINFIDLGPKFKLPKLHQDRLWKKKKRLKCSEAESLSYLPVRKLESGLYFRRDGMRTITAGVIFIIFAAFVLLGFKFTFSSSFCN